MLSPFVCCRKRRPDLQLQQQLQMTDPIQVHQPKGDFNTIYQCVMVIMTYEQVEALILIKETFVSETNNEDSYLW